MAATETIKQPSKSSLEKAIDDLNNGNVYTLHTPQTFPYKKVKVSEKRRKEIEAALEEVRLGKVRRICYRKKF